MMDRSPLKPGKPGRLAFVRWRQEDQHRRLKEETPPRSYK